MDRKKETIERCQYDFASGEAEAPQACLALPRRFHSRDTADIKAEIESDHTAEEYMTKVEAVREGMRQGNYYEVVLRQTFSAPYYGRAPPNCFGAFRNPAPAPTNSSCKWAMSNWWGHHRKCLCGWKGERVETCPIAGTAGVRATRYAMPRAFGSC